MQVYKSITYPFELLDGDPAGDGGELEDVDALVEEVGSLGHADHQTRLAHSATHTSHRGKGAQNFRCGLEIKSRKDPQNKDQCCGSGSRSRSAQIRI